MSDDAVGDQETLAASSAGSRRHLYAEGAALLEEDCHVVGAEALFDQALTNGLLAIAARAIPGHNAGDPTARQPSAAKVLDDLAAIAPVIDGIVMLGTGEPDYDLDERGMLRKLDHEKQVPLHVVQLRDAIARTQTARHGRGPGQQVRPEDVAALIALDQDPSLGTLIDHYADRDWRRAHVDDRAEQARAADYLDLLSNREIERRAAQAADQLGSSSWSDDLDPQECPVCGNEAMQSTGGDDFGYRITAATCHLCSYRRSDRIAYELGMDVEWETRWK